MSTTLTFSVVRIPELGGEVLGEVRLQATPTDMPASVFRQFATVTELPFLNEAQRSVVLQGLADFRLAGPRERPVVLVEDSGRVRFVPFIPLSDATLGEVERTVEAGYMTGDPHEWVVEVEVGWGGEGGDVESLITFLSDRGVNLALDAVVVAAVSAFRKKIGRTVSDRRAAPAARRWADQRGLGSPHELREWLDRKTGWPWSEVSERLGIEPDTAKALLRALGYEADASGTWRLGFSDEAKSARASWLRDEYRGL
ncbi:hypothetical protein [Microbacterium sp. 1P06AB]|uniref:hypothetical protein n=1 Tax=Microbacterium sp. 1P06AB TaxID=3132289 RepID=UPI0039A73608